MWDIILLIKSLLVFGIQCNIDGSLQALQYAEGYHLKAGSQPPQRQRRWTYVCGGHVKQALNAATDSMSVYSQDEMV